MKLTEGILNVAGFPHCLQTQSGKSATNPTQFAAVDFPPIVVKAPGELRHRKKVLVYLLPPKIIFIPVWNANHQHPHKRGPNIPGRLLK